jgi:hypothetical protein
VGFENLDRVRGRFLTVTDGLSQHGAVLLQQSCNWSSVS